MRFKSLIGSLFLAALLSAPMEAAASPICTGPPANNYTIVNDTSPGSLVWNNATGATVANTDAGYRTWLAGPAPCMITSISAVADNGSGLARATVNSTATLTTGEALVVFGTTTYDSAWVITVIDATHIDLQGSTYSVTASGNLYGPQIQATMAGLLAFIDQYNQTLTPPGLLPTTTFSTDYQMLLPVANVSILQNTSGGTVKVLLPKMNLFGSPALGRPFVIRLTAGQIVDIYRQDGTSLFLSQLLGNEFVEIWPSTNDSPNGTQFGRRFPSFPTHVIYGGTFQTDFGASGGTIWASGAGLTQALVSTSPGLTSQLYQQQTGAAPGWVTTSGDCSVSAGAFVCLMLNGVSPGTIWTQNANAVAITGGTITGMGTPSAGTDVANKSYVDSVAAGLSIRDSVAAATNGILSNTPVYNNGASGVGATLTGVGFAGLVVDGYTAQVGDRLLIKDQVAPATNGIYTVTATGGGAAVYVLTRATDYNQASEIFSGTFTFVEQGTVNTGGGFVMTTVGAITVGTTAINWTQFSGAGEITAGTGLTKSGNTLSITNQIAAGGPIGSATVVPIITYNAQGQVTAVSSATIAPPFSAITGQAALTQLPTIGANTALGSVAGGTPIALTQAQLTAMVNLSTASLAGLESAWPNNTTTYRRGDGTWPTLNCAALSGNGPGCSAAAGQLPGTATNDNATAGNVGEYISAVCDQGTATVTISNASPAVISDSATPSIGCAVNFTTTGALPTGLSVGTNYYVIPAGYNAGVSYEVSATPYGTAINTSSAGSGTQSRQGAAILSNGGNSTIAALQPTAGDWDCNGIADIINSGTTTSQKVFIGPTNNSATGQLQFTYQTLSMSAPENILPVGPARVDIASTTTYYLEAYSTFSTGTAVAGAALFRCRRMR